MISVTAKREPGEEEEVTRAKYFIRDEFLVCALMRSILLGAFFGFFADCSFAFRCRESVDK